MSTLWYDNLERHDERKAASREPIQCDIELDGENLNGLRSTYILWSIFVREGGGNVQLYMDTDIST